MKAGEVMSQHINWYPGHMKKTKELIQENLKLVDAVVEVLDSRIPISSKNPQIDDLVGGKPRIVALNKFDLSDPRKLEEWIRYYKSLNIIAIPVNSITGEGLDRLIHEIKLSAKAKQQKLADKGRNLGAVRVMIVGIPNVGKSSLINKLVGKKSAKTGNKPGVTKGKQWIRIRKDLELFDTPGILWPKIDDLQVGLNLAYTGAIKDEILNIEEIALNLVGVLNETYPDLLKVRYKLEELFDDKLELMEFIAKKRGCIRVGNEIDYCKVANLILDEFRKGVIGQISLESPHHVTKNDEGIEAEIIVESVFDNCVTQDGEE